MAGLVPAIHAFLWRGRKKTWMAAQASLRSLRKLGCERGHDGVDAVARHYRFLILFHGSRPCPTQNCAFA
jgi:hypothetical protein